MRALKTIPSHLKRYLVKQDYKRYTPKDHAVWRFILRELTHFFYQNAHKSYKDGIKKTGITLDKIPSVEHIDSCLKKLGWRAGCVSGFIPPAAFLELQAHGILPIATEMRRVENLDYTPAPDIVHEAAGHAPMLVNPHYAKYVRQYAEIASKSIITKKDLDQYEAIRELSDLKEHPNATEDEIQKANLKFLEASRAITEPTEAVLLSRMGWWSTEYGIVQEGKKLKVFGAGLLSSVGEGKKCLDAHVRKIPFSVDCTNYSFDITDPQPQLFVAKNFKHLESELKKLSEKMAYKRGGVFGLERARDAETVNTVELNSGLQISGKLKHFRKRETEAFYLNFEGPCQLSIGGQQLRGHGPKYHSHGFGCPVGYLKGSKKCFSRYSDKELSKLGVSTKKVVTLEFESGVEVTGKVKSLLRHPKTKKLMLVSFTECIAKLGNEVLFDPSWGVYDMAVGSDVVSVFGGPADRLQYGETIDFIASKLPAKSYTAEELKSHKFYKHLNTMIDKKSVSQNEIDSFYESLLQEQPNEWLLYFELLVLAEKHKRHVEWQMNARNLITREIEKYPDIKPIVISALSRIG